jgi:hypothetical protein
MLYIGLLVIACILIVCRSGDDLTLQQDGLFVPSQVERPRTDHADPSPINYNYCDDMNSSTVKDNCADLQMVILNKLRVSGVTDTWDRTQALKFVSKEEFIIFHILAFFGGCENHGTLHMDAWPGYQLREYMIDVGIVNCAEMFLRLHPYIIEEDNLTEEAHNLTDDEYAERSERLYERMQAIENELPSESYEEVNVLVWEYAKKHGLVK